MRSIRGRVRHPRPFWCERKPRRPSRAGNSVAADPDFRTMWVFTECGNTRQDDVFGKSNRNGPPVPHPTAPHSLNGGVSPVDAALEIRECIRHNDAPAHPTAAIPSRTPPRAPLSPPFRRIGRCPPPGVRTGFSDFRDSVTRLRQARQGRFPPSVVQASPLAPRRKARRASVFPHSPLFPKINRNFLAFRKNPCHDRLRNSTIRATGEFFASLRTAARDTTRSRRDDPESLDSRTLRTHSESRRGG